MTIGSKGSGGRLEALTGDDPDITRVLRTGSGVECREALGFSRSAVAMGRVTRRSHD